MDRGEILSRPSITSGSTIVGIGVKTTNNVKGGRTTSLYQLWI